MEHDSYTFNAHCNMSAMGLYLMQKMVILQKDKYTVSHQQVKNGLDITSALQSTFLFD